MSLRINDVAPNFTTDSTAGEITLHDWIGDGYAILFSHPKDFTPVCTTEFGAVAQLAGEFEKRNTKVMGVSVDSVEEHKKWKRDIEAFAGAPANFPYYRRYLFASCKALRHVARRCLFARWAHTCAQRYCSNGVYYRAR